MRSLLGRQGPRARRAAGVALAGALLVAVPACDPTDPPIGPGAAPTTTAVDGSTTTTAGASTTVADPTTTTASPTTTIPAPPAGDPLTLTDTGFTRVRVAIDNDADWVDLRLTGTHFSLTRVVSTGGDLDVVALGGDQITATGRGQAVIDLVLDLRASSGAVLTMCKNHRGPALVEVFRRTTGEQLVGRIDNRQTTAGPGPGGCENPASAAISRSALIGPDRWPARRDARPLVLAGYYPWYDPETLGQIAGDQPTGPADTSNPGQVREAVDLARSSGIDGFVVEWEGSSRYEPRIDLVFDAADARPGFDMALSIDFAILEQRAEGVGAATLDRALAEVAQHAGRPSQLEVAGRPVVFLYAAELVDPGQWAAALARLEARTGLRPFVIGDDADVTPHAQYDYGTNAFPTQDDLGEWVSDRLHKMRLQPGLTGASAPLWVAPVSPGYDDRALGRSQPRYVPRDGGNRFVHSWNAAVATLPDWILVTSWNEYYEQTHVMPGATTGSLALGQVDDRSAVFHTTG